MVVFEDGLPRKGEYRTFAVRGDRTAQDDIAAMREVVSRRFRRYLDDREQARSTSRGTDPAAAAASAAGPGPRPRHRAAAPVRLPPAPRRRRRRRAAGRGGGRGPGRPRRRPTSPLCGLAKRLEEVWLPGDDHPLVLPRTSQGLYLLQRLRDEAHRFAIAYHRQKRSRR